MLPLNPQAPRYQVIGSLSTADGRVITIEQDMAKKKSYMVNDHSKVSSPNKLSHAGSELNAWAALKYAARISPRSHRTEGAPVTWLEFGNREEN